ncbi:MAG TPA: hypothetical protein VMW91_07515 [Desulfosporosinus sp.]|nr:hypothetical protein [Desulfosporosinus sp.]
MNKTVDIKLFDVLLDIADYHGVSYGDWAEASQTHQSRISELKKISRMMKLGRNHKDVGRAVSIVKIHALYNGLAKILGENVVTNDLKKVIDSVKTTKDRILLLSIMTPKEKEQQLELYLRALNEIEREG